MSSETDSVASVERLLAALKDHVYPIIYIGLLIHSTVQITAFRERLKTVEILTYGIHDRVRPDRQQENKNEQHD